jgi:hypothetical protein
MSREEDMAFITTGLANGGVTAHYRFSYDQALAAPGGPEPARTNAVIAACEADYNLMSGWFGGGLTVTGMAVQVTTQSNGASWNGTSTSSTIQLKAQGANYSNNPAYLRYLLIAEVTEIFMMTQNNGWFQGGNEGSKGEGLSRFLSGQFLALHGFLGVGMDADYAVADLWLNSPRQDFVNNDPDDNGYNATNGCTTLFIYYLFSQLGFGIKQIVAAAAGTLAGVHRNLTGDTNDPFPLFRQVLDVWFPSHTSSAVQGPNFDDPWPLLEVAYTGVWRAGNKPYYLWINASQDAFIAKWQALASQNLRLTDLEVTSVNGQHLWSGVWEEGSDGYYLWINADQSHFIAKWQELAAQRLRLVSIKSYNGLWAGVWREGNDGYYLWVDADQSHFIAKWQELAAQNLRLVDFDVSTVNGQRRWAGVWREGHDGYYLWINASWSNFVAKWTELAAQNLRLVGVRNYDGLWAGVWRSGSDPYYLWANTSETSFLSKWSELAGDNLRLVDLVATPIGGEAGANAGADVGAVASAGGERFGSSELRVPVSGVADAAAFGAAAGHGAIQNTGEGGGDAGAGAAPGAGKGGGRALPPQAQALAAGAGEGGGSAIAPAPAAAAASAGIGSGEGGGSDAPAAASGTFGVGAGEGGGSPAASAGARGAEGAGQGGGGSPAAGQGARPAAGTDEHIGMAEVHDLHPGRSGSSAISGRVRDSASKRGPRR